MACDDVAEGKDPGSHWVEGLAFYQSIQPGAARAGGVGDGAMVAYLTGDGSGVAGASGDGALAALSRAALALMLSQDGLVTGYWGAALGFLLRACTDEGE